MSYFYTYLGSTRTAVQRTLGRLEENRDDPRLGTRTFTTEEYGYVRIRASPAQSEDWYIFWCPDEKPDDAVIIDLGPLLL